MKGTGLFISSLLVIDTFLVSFYFGFNSRHVLVIDPKLPPLVPVHAKQPETPGGEKKSAEQANKPEQSEKSGDAKKPSESGSPEKKSGSSHVHKRKGATKKKPA